MREGSSELDVPPTLEHVLRTVDGSPFRRNGGLMFSRAGALS